MSSRNIIVFQRTVPMPRVSAGHCVGRTPSNHRNGFYHVLFYPGLANL